MHPTLKPALRRLRRGLDEEQLGLSPGRRLVLAGLAAADRAVLDALDGTRSEAEVLALGPRAAALLALLRRGAALDEPGPGPAAAALPRPERARLSPDVAQWSLCLPPTARADDVLRARRAATVHVHGAGRVGAPLAALLAAAGVGRVAVVDEARASPADTGPGGLTADDVGTPRGAAASAAVLRAAPSTDAGPARLGEVPDLALLCGRAPGVHRGLAAGLVRAGVPHVVAVVEEARAVVGPLVLPGTSACLECLDLERRDRDAAWPLVAAALSDEGEPHGSPAGPVGDVVLATATAALAAAQGLAWLDADVRADGSRLRRRHDAPGADGPLPSPLGPPAAVGATLELALPGWQWRRRSWPGHPACRCGAPVGPAPPPDGAREGRDAVAVAQ